MAMMATIIICYFLLSKKFFSKFVLPRFIREMQNDEDPTQEELSMVQGTGLEGSRASHEAYDPFVLEIKKENDIETDRSDVGPPKYAIHSLDRSSDGKGLKKIENIDVERNDDLQTLDDDLQKASFLRGERFSWDAPDAPLEAASSPRNLASKIEEKEKLQDSATRRQSPTN